MNQLPPTITMFDRIYDLRPLQPSQPVSAPSQPRPSRTQAIREYLRKHGRLDRDIAATEIAKQGGWKIEDVIQSAREMACRKPPELQIYPKFVRSGQTQDWTPIARAIGEEASPAKPRAERPPRRPRFLIEFEEKVDAGTYTLPVLRTTIEADRGIQFSPFLAESTFHRHPRFVFVEELDSVDYRKLSG